MNNLNEMMADFSVFNVYFWNNQDEYRGYYGPFYTYEEAENKYNEISNIFDHIVLAEVVNHTIIRKSKYYE